MTHLISCLMHLIEVLKIELGRYLIVQGSIAASSIIGESLQMSPYTYKNTKNNQRN